ncbi:SRPBCC family protein [Flavobacterium sp. DGU38]|uniref:SRPBCC family protein n=1 Tax=Flavobacterium calami TaxID=3139144 RepID=A0ABU9ILY0_9FLAO
METNRTALAQKLKNIRMKTNVSAFERIVMLTSGSYLLYKGLSEEKKNVGKIGTGGTMLLRGLSGYCPVYDAVDHLKNGKASNINIRINSTVNKPIAAVYAFWRDFENFPKFMKHLDSVKPINYTTSKWTVKGPAGIGKISWKAEIVKDEKEKIISWNSLPDSAVKNAGKVTFKPKGNATEIDITISYHAPLGVAGEGAAKLLNPYFAKLVKDDVMNFKTYLESI